MDDKTVLIRDEILEALLPDIAFDGWIWGAVEKASERAGHGSGMASAVFAGGLNDVVGHFSDWADRKMLAALEKINPDDLRIRDRIRTAAITRFDVLLPHRDAVRLALSYWAGPFRAGHAGKMVWNTADRMWNWAGDTATDYNRYTKRGLLSGVLSATTLVWLDDDSPDQEVTHAFLDRRIENVMQLGRFLGTLKKSAPSFTQQDCKESEVS